MTTVLVRSAAVTTYSYKLSRLIKGENPYFAMQVMAAALPLLILLGGSMAKRRPLMSGRSV